MPTPGTLAGGKGRAKFGTGLGALIGLLVVALVVVPLSFAVAVRADATTRRLIGSRAPEENRGGLLAVAEEVVGVIGGGSG